MSFSDLLQKRFDNQLFVSVGLDPVVEKLPSSITSKYTSVEDQLFQFNKAIIDATQEFVAVFKPNSAFYEAYGVDGIKALKKTCDYIKSQFPEIPVLIDAKRGDIGNTNIGYAKFVFDYLGADAITVIPYLGIESLDSYFAYKDKGIIIGCHSSNPGAKEFQELDIGGKPLYHYVAEEVMKKHGNNPNCMIFMGATYPQELIEIRQIVGDMPILIPGIGAQGGDLASTVKNGKNSKGQGIIVSSSRGIIFASSGDDFAEAARKEAQKLSDEIRKYL